MSSDNGSKRKMRNTHLGIEIDNRPKKQKMATGDKAKLRKLDELQAVTKEIEERFEVSEKLFVKKRKLKEQLGIEIFS